MDFRKILQVAQKQSMENQRGHAKEIIEAFRAFWKTKPSEKEFTKLTEGLVIFPEIVYIMSTS